MNIVVANDDTLYIVHSTFAVPEEKAEEVISIYKNRSRRVDEATKALVKLPSN